MMISTGLSLITLSEHHCKKIPICLFGLPHFDIYIGNKNALKYEKGDPRFSDNPKNNRIWPKPEERGPHEYLQFLFLLKKLF